MKTNLKKLREFLLLANKSTYASEDSSIRTKQKDNSTTITFKSGDYSYHDNYFGGEPYGGREVIFYKNKPIWMMVYYGWVLQGNNTDSIYKILTKALREATLQMPYRGPKKLVDSNMTYLNNVNGDLVNFNGEEKILDDKIIVYTARYMGGVIDQ